MYPSSLEETIAALRQFEPFCYLEDSDLLVIATRTVARRQPTHHELFQVGDADQNLHCLLEGTVSLVARDGRGFTVHAGTQPAAKPISPLKPRQHSATAVTPIAFLEVDVTGLSDLHKAIMPSGYSVDDIVEGEIAESPDTDVFDHHAALLSSGMEVPTLPEIALQTRRLIDQDQAEIGAIAAVVNRDPAIAAKLVKAANSALFRGQSQVQSCEQAIMRLGTHTTRQLVVTFALRDLFQTQSAALAGQMRQVWQHSNEVAAICLVLAQLTGRFEPEEALLAGLLHDIGVLPILHYAARHPDLAAAPLALSRLIGDMRARTGVTVLREWNFPEQFVTAACDAEDWWRNPAPDPDMADLVIVAQIHSFMGKQTRPPTPPLVRLPAFRKLADEDAGPRLSEQVLAGAKDQIAVARSLLLP